jgi:Fe-S oxidoreductase
MRVSQYVERLLNEGRLRFDRRVEKTVTYHDPCHLGRHGGVFEAPRNVIKAIPGIKFVEMPRNRRESRCCGAGAGFKAQHNAHALNIAVDRFREAHETGADEIITTCPFCLVNLNAGADQAGIELKTRDLLQLIMEAIRPEEQPDGASGRGGTAVSPADR